jgi:predicted phosphoribosyltransferase
MQPELSVGAVAAGGLIVLDDGMIARLGISVEDLGALIELEREELARKERLYRGGRGPLELEGQTVILVDDGLATGYTMLVAVRAVRGLKAACVVVAAPIAPPDTVDMLRREADEVVCVHVARRLVAVGRFYEDFSQTTDDEVCRALAGKNMPA